MRYPATQELWRGLSKNVHDHVAVTATLRENNKIMEEAAQAGRSFETVRKEAAKSGFPFSRKTFPITNVFT